MKIPIYSPADEDLEFMYNARLFVVPANKVTEIESPWPEIPAEALVQALLKQHGDLGVTRVGENRDEAIVKAEEVYAHWIKAHSMKILERHAAEVERHKKLGLKPPDPGPDVERSKSRLKARHLLASLLLMLFASSVAAQQTSRPITLLYDVDSATMTYCKVDGPNAGSGRVSTSGSSATVTGSNSDSFASLAAGDVLQVQTGSSSADVTLVAVTAVASGTSLTIADAQDWSAGYAFTWYDQTCGTTDADGWVNLSGISNRTIVVAVEAGVTDTAGIDAVWECRSSAPGAAPVQVYPNNWPSDVGTAAVQNFADAAFGTKQARRAIWIPETWSQCRVGLALNTADDTADADIEEVNVYAQGLAP